MVTFVHVKKALESQSFLKSSLPLLSKLLTEICYLINYLYFWLAGLISSLCVFLVSQQQQKKELVKERSFW